MPFYWEWKLALGIFFLASGASAASMTSTATTTSVASMTSAALFHQKTYRTWCFHQPWHQNDLSYSLLMWDGSSKIQFFIDFWHPFSWRLWRTGMLLLTKLKGHRWNFHYSGPQKAQLVDAEFKIQVTQGVQNIQNYVGTPCSYFNIWQA